MQQLVLTAAFFLILIRTSFQNVSKYGYIIIWLVKFSLKNLLYCYKTPPKPFYVKGQGDLSTSNYAKVKCGAPKGISSGIFLCKFLLTS